MPYRKAPSDTRVLSVPDAVMFATCLYLQDAYGVTMDLFHTFDDGKKKKTLPQLSYHEWCEGLTGENAKLAGRVCSLRRERPTHPAPEFFFPRSD
jgi:hypothetical protein